MEHDLVIVQSHLVADPSPEFRFPNIEPCVLLPLAILPYACGLDALSSAPARPQ